MTSRRKRAIVYASAAAFAIAWGLSSWIATAAFLIDVSGAGSGIRRWLPVSAETVSTRDLTVPTRYGPVAARAFLPGGATTSRTAIVFPGIHGGGADEPRL